MTTPTTTLYDPFSDEVQANPYPSYARTTHPSTTWSRSTPMPSAATPMCAV
jgi:hypothetical protein